MGGAETGAPSASGSTLRIGAAAERAGVSERALRYYEELGLLSPATHRPGGNRRYSDADLARVRRIRELKELLGFNLDEIRGLLAGEDALDELRARWQASRGGGERLRILREGIGLTEDLRARVEATRSRLSAYLDELDARLSRCQALVEELSAEGAEIS